MNKLSFSVYYGADIDTIAGIAVGGKTFDVKEDLKAAGAVWSPGAQRWIFRELRDIAAARVALGLPAEEPVKPVKRVRKPKVMKPEEMIARLDAAIAAGWVCCRRGAVDWACKTVACDAHGVRVRGCCYTGD